MPITHLGDTGGGENLGATSRLGCFPVDTTTQPPCKRSQLERELTKTAVAMKYSSHEGRVPALTRASSWLASDSGVFIATSRIL